MRVDLVKIPGVPDTPGAFWRVRALVVEGKSPALAAIAHWEQTEHADYRKIIKALRMAAAEQRCRNEKHVRKCANKKHGDVYEARADKGHARLLFFHSQADDAVIVCTNDFWKGKGGGSAQDQSFAMCAKLKSIYERHSHES